MARDIETRSAPVAVADMGPSGPSRTVGMVWRKSSPMAEQLGDIADTVRSAARAA